MLLIRQSVYRDICEHMQKVSPLEGCGILGGDFLGGAENRRADKFFAVSNAAKSPDKFIMDSQEQLSAIKALRALDLEMVGICHSHPRTAAYPSVHDVRLAAYEEVSYLIVSLVKKEEPLVKSFRIINGGIAPEEISVV